MVGAVRGVGGGGSGGSAWEWWEGVGMVGMVGCEPHGQGWEVVGGGGVNYVLLLGVGCLIFLRA